MNDLYISLWFEAPLQSWGSDSKFGRRDTQKFPTKSGVLGVVFAAMGAGGKQREFLAEFADLDLAVISYSRTKDTFSGKSKVDSEPVLRDFHMVGSGYDDRDPWANLLIPKTSEGKKAVGGGTKVTQRFYLQDAAFGVALEVPSDKADIIVQALQNPAWDVYLGRKCCVPTEFIYWGKFDHRDESLAKSNAIAQQKNRVEDFRVMQGATSESDEIITLNDVPLQFGEEKLYRDRQVSLTYAR